MQPNMQHQKSHVLVTYFSRRGRTQRMAEEVAAGGAEVAETLLTLKTVADVTAEDLLQADGIVIGSPVYFGTLSAAVKSFIEDWQFQFDFYPSYPLRDKVGAAFATGGQQSGGQELAMLSILSAMLHQRMIVISGESPLGASAETECKDEPLTKAELTEARALGRRVAQLAAILKTHRPSDVVSPDDD